MRLPTSNGGMLLIAAIPFLVAIVIATPCFVPCRLSGKIEAVGPRIHGLALQARARAIRTGAPSRLLFAVGDGTDNPVVHAGVRVDRGEIVLLDASGGLERSRLPARTEFVAGTSSHRYPPVVEVRFDPDGTLEIAGRPDRAHAPRIARADFVERLLAQKSAGDWAGSFDLVVENFVFTAVCLVDFDPGTGRVCTACYPQ